MSITICIGRPTIDKAASGEPVDVGQGVVIIAADDLFHASPYAEIERLRAELQKLADQKTIGELSEAGEDCEGDFEGDYDTMIDVARKALSPQT